MCPIGGGGWGRSCWGGVGVGAAVWCEQMRQVYVLNYLHVADCEHPDETAHTY